MAKLIEVARKGDWQSYQQLKEKFNFSREMNEITFSSRYSAGMNFSKGTTTANSIEDSQTSDTGLSFENKKSSWIAVRRIVRKIDINKQLYGDGDSALHAAIGGSYDPLSDSCNSSMHTAIAIDLLEQKAIKVNLTITGNITPLMLACRYGNIVVVRAICKHRDVNLNIRSEPLGYSALDWAIENGRDEIVNILINANANLLEPTKLGFLPIQRAIIFCKLKTIVNLLKRVAPFLPMNPEERIGKSLINMRLSELAAENSDPTVKKWMRNVENALLEGKLLYFLQEYTARNLTMLPTVESTDSLQSIPIEQSGLTDAEYQLLQKKDQYLLSTYILKHYNDCSSAKQQHIQSNHILSRLLSDKYEQLNQHLDKLISKISSVEAEKICNDITSYLFKADTVNDVDYSYHQMMSMQSIGDLQRIIKPFEEYKRQIICALFGSDSVFGSNDSNFTNLGIRSTRRFLNYFSRATIENRKKLEHIVEVSAPLFRIFSQDLKEAGHAFFNFLEIQFPLKEIPSSEKSAGLMQACLIKIMRSKCNNQDHKAIWQVFKNDTTDDGRLLFRLLIVTAFAEKLTSISTKEEMGLYLSSLINICKVNENKTLLEDKLAQLEELLLTNDFLQLMEQFYLANQPTKQAIEPVTEVKEKLDPAHEELEEPSNKSNDHKLEKGLEIILPSSPSSSLASPLPHHMSPTQSSDAKRVDKKEFRKKRSPEKISPLLTRQVSNQRGDERTLQQFSNVVLTVFSELSLGVKQGFGQLNDRIGSLDARLNNVELKLSTLSQKEDSTQLMIKYSSNAQKDLSTTSESTENKDKKLLIQKQTERNNNAKRLEQKLARLIKENEILPNTHSERAIRKLEREIADAVFTANVATNIAKQSISDNPLLEYFSRRFITYYKEYISDNRKIRKGELGYKKSLSEQAFGMGVAMASSMAPAGNGVIAAGGNFLSTKIFGTKPIKEAVKIDAVADRLSTADSENKDDIAKRLAEHFNKVYQNILLELCVNDLDKIAKKAAKYVVTSWKEAVVEDFLSKTDFDPIQFIHLMEKMVKDYAEKSHSRLKLETKLNGRTAFVASLLHRGALVLENGHIMLYRKRAKEDGKLLESQDPTKPRQAKPKYGCRFFENVGDCNPTYVERKKYQIITDKLQLENFAAYQEWQMKPRG